MDEERTEIKRPVHPSLDDLREHAGFTRCSLGAQGFYLRFVTDAIDGADIPGVAAADYVEHIACCTGTPKAELRAYLNELIAAGMIGNEGGVYRDLFFDWSESRAYLAAEDGGGAQ